MTPDEKLRSRGDQIITTFLSKDVSFSWACSTAPNDVTLAISLYSRVCVCVCGGGVCSLRSVSRQQWFSLSSAERTWS